MARGIFAAIVWSVLLSASASAAVMPDSSASKRAQPAEPIKIELCEAWQTVRRAEVDSAEFVRASERLGEIVSQLPPLQRLEAAAALMDRYASENVNAAALELFGRDVSDVDEIRRILFDDVRSFRHRVLLRTYFSLCRDEYRAPQLSEQAQLTMVVLLTERIESLTGKRVGYGEQRLLTHLSESLLSRYAEAAETHHQVVWLLKAMDTYALAAPEGDTFAASVGGWLELRSNPLASLEGANFASVDGAVASLGHWDPLVRWKAAYYLGRQARRQSEVVEAVWAALADPRDEVRAAAITVFAIAVDIEPKRVVEKLVEILTRDWGVTVQSAASVALSARADQAKQAVEPLLEAFEFKRGRYLPGNRRTNSILMALARLANRASKEQREKMLELAVAKLPEAPEGALRLLKALGPTAKSAAAKVKLYRRNAYRFERQYIDRHVLPAMGISAAAKIDD